MLKCALWQATLLGDTCLDGHIATRTGVHVVYEEKRAGQPWHPFVMYLRWRRCCGVITADVGHAGQQRHRPTAYP